ncbi:MAG: hypothetical protein IKD72_07460 [Clostridia bacterium]|nr:hypothetical protein [Clostridia bacterium]
MYFFYIFIDFFKNLVIKAKKSLRSPVRMASAPQKSSVRSRRPCGAQIALCELHKLSAENFTFMHLYEFFAEKFDIFGYYFLLIGEYAQCSAAAGDTGFCG